MKWFLRACASAFVLVSLPAVAATDTARSRIAEAQFRSANPCPVTGHPQGPCAGYVVDRLIPVACGGAEHPDNMRWITVAEARAKARWERIGCRRGRKLVLPGESQSITEAFPLSEAAEPVQAEPLTGASKAEPDAPAASEEASAHE